MEKGLCNSSRVLLKMVQYNGVKENQKTFFFKFVFQKIVTPCGKLLGCYLDEKLWDYIQLTWLGPAWGSFPVWHFPHGLFESSKDSIDSGIPLVTHNATFDLAYQVAVIS